MTEVRHDWALKDIEAIYHQPLMTLLYDAHTIHRRHFPEDTVQFCTLANIKQGRCSEDCKYCSQSAHHKTFVEPTTLSNLDEILKQAKAAKKEGSTRFFMGAAWRNVPKGERFEKVLDLVRGVADLGMEVCCTLGMLDHEQALRLKEAGLTAYNHNLDTSPEYYPKVVTTHTYQERLDTIKNVADAGISVCCGGIIGMGESITDRLRLLEVISNLDPQPESTPINILTKIEGTPFGDIHQDVTPLELTRLIATARQVLPKTRIRLSAGRKELPLEAHALCFFAGANSIFTGEKLLTTQNAGTNKDHEILKALNMTIEPQSSVSGTH